MINAELWQHVSVINMFCFGNSEVYEVSIDERKNDRSNGKSNKIIFSFILYTQFVCFTVSKTKHIDYRHMLPQYCINHDNVILLMISTKKCNFSQAQ
jgi:hypothetical protein